MGAADATGGIDAGRPLTREQFAALDMRAGSVALSAGAGCGKTYVLTQRYLSHLEASGKWAEPETEIEDLVAITFTDRAAREMRDRIRTECRRRVKECPAEEAEHWLKLLRSLDSARISTIHSFCTSLLQAHAVEAGLDPHFAVLEPAQAGTVLAELVADFLRQKLSELDEAALELAHHYDLGRLQSLLMELLGERHRIDFAVWRNVPPSDLVVRWKRFLEEILWPQQARLLGTCYPSQDLAAVLKAHVPSHPVMAERRQLLLDGLSQLAASGESAPSREILAELNQVARVKGTGRGKAWESESVYEEVKSRLKDFREQVKAAAARFTWNADRALEAADLGLKLLALAAEVNDLYDARKRELRGLDFDDLVGRARDLLADPAHEQLRNRLARRTRLLLVDEFQDTDPVQADLVRLLCDGVVGDGKLFIVGDSKQSIYRFRGADPKVFRALREEIPAAGRLPLSQNFRSQPQILHFVNYLFVQELGGESEYEPLVPFHPQVAAGPCVEFLWALPETEEQRSAQESVEIKRRREAEWIARRLRQLLDEGEPLVRDEQNGEPVARPLRAGDVAVLFRALTDLAYYEPAFRKYGLEYYLVGGQAFFAQQEVYDLLNLFKAIALPTDEISLAGVLRSPFFNLTDETLYWLTRQSRSLSRGFDSTMPPPQLNPQQRQAVLFAQQTLADLRDAKDRLPIAELVKLALAKTGYDATLVAEFMGERKLANLNKLVDLARSFDRSGFLTFSDYITQLSEFVAKQPKEPPAATQPETSNVIKVMSIHQAKGLEFPLVVVPDLGRASNASRSSVAFDPHLGPLVRPPKSEPGATGKQLFDWIESAEDEAEQVRLLYVAATRAADYLILSSGLENLEKPSSQWMQLLARRFDLAGGTPRDAESDRLLQTQLGAENYQTPSVRVTTGEPPAPAGGTARDRLPDLTAVAERAEKSRNGEIPVSVRPISPDLQARTRWSVSRIRGVLEEPRMHEDPSLRGELSGEEAAALGRIVHGVLERLDFSQPQEVSSVVGRQVAEHGLEPDASIRPDAIVRLISRLLQSPLGQRLAAARTVLREVEFLLAWPPETAAGEDGIHLHGFIDALYQDRDGGWHVIDYKTDHVTPESLEQKTAAYEMQILLYALAAEQALGEPPVDTAVCFLSTGDVQSIPWDEAARTRARRLIDQGLAVARQSSAFAT